MAKLNIMLNEHINTFNSANNPEILSKINYFADTIINCIKHGNKVLIAGNGGSAADAQHFAAELVVRLKYNRNAIPVIALTTDTSTITAIGNDFGYDKIFSRQLQALGKPGDIFIGISTSGDSGNIISATNVAKELGICTFILTGKTGGEICSIIDQSNVIIAPSNNTARIQEFHEFVLHVIAEIVEDYFYKLECK